MAQDMNRYRHNWATGHSAHQGFTMVELMAVVLIIGILMSIALGTYNGIRAQGWRTRARDTSSQISQAWNVYLMDHREFPARADLPWEHETTEANLSYIAPRSGVGRVYLEVSEKEWLAGRAAFSADGGLVDPWKRRYLVRLDNESDDLAYDGLIEHPDDVTARPDGQTTLNVRSSALVWSRGNTPARKDRWIVQW